MKPSSVGPDFERQVVRVFVRKPEPRAPEGALRLVGKILETIGWLGSYWVLSQPA